MAFHANDGLFFKRLPDGSVEVTHRVPVLDDSVAYPVEAQDVFADPQSTPEQRRAAGAMAVEGSRLGFAVLHRWVLGCAAPGQVGDCTWASVVASMSKPGETSDTFRGALDFHDGRAIKPPSGVMANVSLALASLSGYTGAGKDDPCVVDAISLLRAAVAAAGE